MFVYIHGRLMLVPHTPANGANSTVTICSFLVPRVHRSYTCHIRCSTIPRPSLSLYLINPPRKVYLEDFTDLKLGCLSVFFFFTKHDEPEKCQNIAFPPVFRRSILYPALYRISWNAGICLCRSTTCQRFGRGWIHCSNFYRTRSTEIC